MYLDQPQHHVQELLNATLWPNHPLGRPLTGTERTLDAIGRPHLLRFLHNYYVTTSTVIAAAGRLNHRSLVRTITHLSRRFPRGPHRNFLPAAPHQHHPRTTLFTKDTEQTQMALGIRICSRHDRRRYALRILNTVLGENMSSRLFQSVREDRGLAYAIYSSLGYFEDTGVLTISAGLDTANVSKTLPLILKELRRLRCGPPTPAELRRARDYIIGQMDLSLENTESQMNWVGEQWLGFRRIYPAAEIRMRLREVRAADVQAVARDFFQPNRMNLALVSPLKSDRSLARCWEALG
jgi:predicted Zn-dependent peptidase